MQLQLQEHLKHLLIKYKDLITPQQRSRIKKLLPLLKNVAKSSKDLNITQEDFYGSMRQQIEGLDRKIKNMVKFQMTDYQAFRWQLKKQGKSHCLPQLFSKLKIPEKNLNNQKQWIRQQILQLNTLSMSVEQLCHISHCLLEQNKQSKKLFTNQNLFRLIKTIAGEYNITSYHNFTHGVSVQIMFNQLQNKCKLNQLYTNLDLFLAQIAALVHDMGHKGFNSMWQIKRKSKLATLYEEESVLQKMHLARFFRLLKQHEQLNFFQQITDVYTRQKSKQLITSLVLSTDMSKHFKSIKCFQDKYKQNSINFKQQNKQLIIELIFHGCDIGNPCMQFQEYLNWSILLAYQFNNQASEEQKQNIMITQGFKYSSIDNFYDNQVGFINLFCLPLWKQVSKIYPEVQIYYEKAKKNSQKIKSIIKCNDKT